MSEQNRKRVQTLERLTDIVAEYVGEKHASGTAWYAWDFDPDRVPPGVLDGG